MRLGFAHSVVGGAVLRFLRLVCFLSSCAGLSNLWAHSESVQPTDLIENLVLADPSSVRQVTAPAGAAVAWLPLLMLGRSLVEGEVLPGASPSFTRLRVTLHWISGRVPGFWGPVNGFYAVICYAIHAALVFSLQKHWTVTTNQLWNCINLYERGFVFTCFVLLWAKDECC